MLEKGDSDRKPLVLGGHFFFKFKCIIHILRMNQSKTEDGWCTSNGCLILGCTELPMIIGERYGSCFAKYNLDSCG